MDEVVGMNFGENWISIDEDVDYDRDAHAKVQEVVDGYPGLRRDVQTYLKERIREVLTGSSETIVVHIFGDDLPRSRRPPRTLLAGSRESTASVEANIELQDDVPQVEVQVDLATAQSLRASSPATFVVAATMVAERGGR